MVRHQPVPNVVSAAPRISANHSTETTSAVYISGNCCTGERFNRTAMCTTGRPKCRSTLDQPAYGSAPKLQRDFPHVCMSRMTHEVMYDCQLQYCQACNHDHCPIGKYLWFLVICLQNPRQHLLQDGLHFQPFIFLTPEGEAAGEHAVQQDAAGPDVSHLASILVVQQHLWRNILRRACSWNVQATVHSYTDWAPMRQHAGFDSTCWCQKTQPTCAFQPYDRVGHAIQWSW